MRILDMSAGNRAMWFDKNNEQVFFCDIRESVKPTIVCDTRNLPFSDSSYFDLIVFDPPHVNFGQNAIMSKAYGYHTTNDIRDIITKSAAEAYRVSSLTALMALKWNDHDQKLDRILKLMPQWIPLFGQKVAVRQKHASGTYWVVLQKAMSFKIHQSREENSSEL